MAFEQLVKMDRTPVFLANAFGEKRCLWPFSSPLHVLVPCSVSQTSISWPSRIGSVCKEMCPQHNSWLSSLVLTRNAGGESTTWFSKELWDFLFRMCNSEKALLFILLSSVSERVHRKKSGLLGMSSLVSQIARTSRCLSSEQDSDSIDMCGGFVKLT